MCCQPGPFPTNPFPVPTVAMTPLYTSTGPAPPGEFRLSVVIVDPGLLHGAEHAPPGPHWESTLQAAPGVGPPEQAPPQAPAQTPPAPQSALDEQELPGIDPPTHLLAPLHEIPGVGLDEGQVPP